jgi:hypothetical protein
MFGALAYRQRNDFRRTCQGVLTRGLNQLLSAVQQQAQHFAFN